MRMANGEPVDAAYDDTVVDLCLTALAPRRHGRPGSPSRQAEHEVLRIGRYAGGG
jgi:hypothetical protein